MVRILVEIDRTRALFLSGLALRCEQIFPHRFCPTEFASSIRSFSRQPGSSVLGSRRTATDKDLCLLAWVPQAYEQGKANRARFLAALRSRTRLASSRKPTSEDPVQPVLHAPMAPDGGRQPFRGKSRAQQVALYRAWKVLTCGSLLEAAMGDALQRSRLPGSGIRFPP
jgi:hypothetical protein